MLDPGSGEGLRSKTQWAGPVLLSGDWNLTRTPELAAWGIKLGHRHQPSRKGWAGTGGCRWHQLSKRWLQLAFDPGQQKPRVARPVHFPREDGNVHCE